MQINDTSSRTDIRYASSVRHQQYHGMDVVTVWVRENEN